MQGFFTAFIELNIWLQSFSNPFLDTLFRAITFLGNEEFYLILPPLLYWCFDKRMGARLTVLFLLSSYLNEDLKDLFRVPRPFIRAPDKVRALVTEEPITYCFPSGHAQSTTVVWGYLATQVRKRWAWIVALVIPFLVGLSRIYLGVHHVMAVLGGWAIGGLLILLGLWFMPAMGRSLARGGLSAQLPLAVAVPLALFLVHPTEGTAATMGTLIGMGIGVALERRLVGFSAWGVWWKRVLRLLLGLVVLLALYFGLKMIFPGVEEAGWWLGLTFRLIRYGLVGLWAGWLAPWLFVITGLAEREEEV
ncbi:MAG: phosphatase PAP2 family protein [Anaerolineae bacterium]|jgi:membrane-associated phospholipid phosphatase|nr:phosphatase PAP2 family protein [Anaerolineae bacterium]MDH7474875.1 phosphatase PAP2 family protein [Anaerolineae bacterium]